MWNSKILVVLGKEFFKFCWEHYKVSSYNFGLQIGSNEISALMTACIRYKEFDPS